MLKSLILIGLLSGLCFGDEKLCRMAADGTATSECVSFSNKAWKVLEKYSVVGAGKGTKGEPIGPFVDGEGNPQATLVIADAVSGVIALASRRNDIVGMLSNKASKDAIESARKAVKDATVALDTLLEAETVK